MQKILFLDTLPVELVEIIKQGLPDGFELIEVDSGNPDSAYNKIADVDFLLSMSQHVTGDLIRAGKKLKMIHQWGVGVDKIDLETARACNIPVARTTGVNSIGVAEHTILLMLALYRQLIKADSGVKAGAWPKWELRLNNYELRGKTIGILGFGSIGREVAKRLSVFDVNTYYYDVFKIPRESEKPMFVKGWLSIDEMVEKCDAITIHCPLNKDTRFLMNKERFKAMKNTALLINCARGPIVDEKALYWALTSGEIAGAGLDVFEQEPISPDNPLLKLPNVILTPHVASATLDTMKYITQRIFENMRRVAEGKAIEQIYSVERRCQSPTS